MSGRIISTIWGKGQGFLGIGLPCRFWSLIIGFRTTVAPTCQCRRCKRHRFSSLHWKDPLEEDMATQSSILAWRIPWSEEPGGLWSIGSQRVGHDWSNLARMHTYILRMPPASHRKKNLFPVDIVGVFFRLHGGDFSQGSTINGDTNPSHPSFFTPGRI